MYGQRRSLMSGANTGARSFVLKTQWMFMQEKVFAIRNFIWTNKDKTQSNKVIFS
jgi:hypothetical protein